MWSAALRAKFFYLVLLVFSIKAHALVQVPYELVDSFSHNNNYFTQGFVYEKPYLYESTGLYKQSRLIKYHYINNQLRLIEEKRLPDNIFAEGLSLYKDQLYMLTYKQQKLYIYDKETLAYKGEKPYQGEGWGLQYAMNQFYMTNGSDILFSRSPKDFSILHKNYISINDKKVKQVNEMDWANGYIVANVWHDQRLLFINPFTAKVKAYIDLKPLMDEYKISARNVANGVAFDAENNSLFITGKNWPYIFIIKPDFSLL